MAQQDVEFFRNLNTGQCTGIGCGGPGGNQAGLPQFGTIAGQTATQNFRWFCLCPGSSLEVADVAETVFAVTTPVGTVTTATVSGDATSQLMPGETITVHSSSPPTSANLLGPTTVLTAVFGAGTTLVTFTIPISSPAPAGGVIVLVGEDCTVSGLMCPVEYDCDGCPISCDRECEDKTRVYFPQLALTDVGALVPLREVGCCSGVGPANILLPEDECLDQGGSWGGAKVPCMTGPDADKDPCCIQGEALESQFNVSCVLAHFNQFNNRWETDFCGCGEGGEGLTCPATCAYMELTWAAGSCGPVDCACVFPTGNPHLVFALFEEDPDDLCNRFWRGQLCPSNCYPNPPEVFVMVEECRRVTVEIEFFGTLTGTIPLGCGDCRNKPFVLEGNFPLGTECQITGGIMQFDCDICDTLCPDGSCPAFDIQISQSPCQVGIDNPTCTSCSQAVCSCNRAQYFERECYENSFICPEQTLPPPAPGPGSGCRFERSIPDGTFECITCNPTCSPVLGTSINGSVFAQLQCCEVNPISGLDEWTINFGCDYQYPNPPCDQFNPAGENLKILIGFGPLGLPPPCSLVGNQYLAVVNNFVRDGNLFCWEWQTTYTVEITQGCCCNPGSPSSPLPPQISDVDWNPLTSDY